MQSYSDSQCVCNEVPVVCFRLLAQLDETENAFEQFWCKHHLKLEQCLQLRHFEQDFREVRYICRSVCLSVCLAAFGLGLLLRQLQKTSAVKSHFEKHIQPLCL